MKRNSYYKKNNKSGFTLVEMLFVVAIFAILTAIMIFNYGNFNKNVIMTNTAYDVALEIRQAQVYSLGARRASNTTSSGDRSEFKVRYGVYFDTSSDLNFMSFNDKYPPPSGLDSQGIPILGDGLCNDSKALTSICDISTCTSTGECDILKKLNFGIKFDKLCVSSSNDPVDLNSGNCGTNASKVTSLHITFQRPYTDALIAAPKAGGGYDKNLGSAGIVLSSSAGSKRAVVVRSTGQISVEFVKN